jgi:L-rhamnose mutarotase
MTDSGKPKRYGSVTLLKDDRVEKYVELHKDPWPGVLKRLSDSNIGNYSIFIKKLPDGHHYLFSYFEYYGDDFDADTAAIAADPTTQEWWKECCPCIEPFDELPDGEYWAPMEEVFHHD